jgi:hypothetical protein
MRRTVTIIFLLELFALCLVLLVLPSGLHTDEAKYLLNIPYPHPPAARSFFFFLTFLPFHQAVVRFLLASITVQAVWLVWDMGSVLTPVRRVMLVACWLLSAALLLQAGSAMLAPLTAVFALAFVWAALLPAGISPRAAPFLALLWLLGLFSAYQTVLFLPLVWAALRRGRVPMRFVMLYVLIPVFLLALYSFTNPLALASMLRVTGQDVSLPLSSRLLRVGWIWLVAGSGIASIAGTWGILTSKKIDLLLTAILVVMYILLSPQDYYAILFVPLLVAGAYILLCRRRLSPTFFIPLQGAMAALFLVLLLPSPHRTLAEEVMEFLQVQGTSGVILIDGFFGHEWQYFSPVPIRRYSQELAASVEDEAQAIVCTRISCEENIDREQWVRLGGAPAEVWVRR